MAQARDIRRDVAAPTPNTFVYQPVVDTSMADLAKNLTGIGLKLDADLAQERFKKASEMLNAQYVVGSPAAGALLEDSPSDNVKLSPEDDRSLRDFQEVLNTNQLARDQGRMNYQSYQLRQERLLRIAIAKRPGLAAEFRNIATAYVGADVTGAEARFLAEQEREMAKAAAEQAKDQQDAAMKRYTYLRDQFVEAGIPEAAFLTGPDDPRAQEVFSNPLYMAQHARYVRTKAEAQVAADAVQIKGANQEANRFKATKDFELKVLEGFGQIDAIGNTILEGLRQNGMEDDPKFVRQGLQTFLNEAEARKSELIVQAEASGVDEATLNRAIARYDARIDYWRGVASMEDDKQLLENVRQAGQTLREINLLESDEDFARFQAQLNLFPQGTREFVMNQLKPQMAVYINKVMTDISIPDDLVLRGPALLPQMASMLRNPTTGNIVPPAVDMYVQTAAKTAQAFALVPDANNVQITAFTRDPRTGKNGIVGALREQFPVLKDALSPEQKTEIYAGLGMGYANMQRRALRAIVARNPAMRDLVEINPAFHTGQAFKFKPGVTQADLTPQQVQLLNTYNAELQPKTVAETMAQYGGVTPEQAAEDTWNRLYPAARKRREAAGTSSGARAGAGSRGSSSSSTRGSGSASGALKAGDVIDGYRYKGGNPNSQSSWEKVR